MYLCDIDVIQLLLQCRCVYLTSNNNNNNNSNNNKEIGKFLHDCFGDKCGLNINLVWPYFIFFYSLILNLMLENINLEQVTDFDTSSRDLLQIP